MQQNLPESEFAANMYSIYRLQLDIKLYKTDEEKAYMEQQLKAYEEYFLQAQDNKNLLAELGFSPINPAGGSHRPPAF